jgi:chromosome segregation ATPase
MSNNISLSRSEYELLRDSMSSLSTKLDAVLTKINNIDNKTVALEEWRKHHESIRSNDQRAIEDLQSRVVILEKYRFYLIGMATVISILIAVIASLYK